MSSRSLFYSNERAMSIEFSRFGSYFLTEFEQGFTNDLKLGIQFGLDGGMFKGHNVSAREVCLSGYLMGERDEIFRLKSEISKIFNPKIGGELYYYDTYNKKKEKRKLKCYPKGSVSFGLRNNRAYFTVELLAPNPYWLGEEITEDICTTTRLGRFPMGITKDYVFGKRLDSLNSKFLNVGDTDVGFECVMYAEFGTVKNPTIKCNKSGEKIKLNTELNKYDFVRITNYPHKKAVTLNDEVNIFGSLNAGESNFFTLEVGENVLGYSADENATNLRVVVTYGPEYIY